jgi:phosphatidylglycerophosphate synthase
MCHHAIAPVRLLLIPVRVVLLAQRDYTAALAALFILALSDFADG